jgi:hypothetical protein
MVAEEIIHKVVDEIAFDEAIPKNPSYFLQSNFIAEVFFHYDWSESYSFCPEGHYIRYQAPTKLLADSSKPKQAPDQ